MNEQISKLHQSISQLKIEVLKLQQYLNKTDYKIIKAYETNTEIDPIVKQKRQDARNTINEIKLSISILEKQLKEIQNG